MFLLCLSIRIVPEPFDDYGKMGNLMKYPTRILTIYMKFAHWLSHGMGKACKG